MPQSSNYDPAAGQYHADPMWSRYQQPPQPISTIPGAALSRLQKLMQPSSPELPPYPAAPELPMGEPASTRPVPDNVDMRADDIIGRSQSESVAAVGAPALKGLQDQSPVMPKPTPAEGLAAIGGMQSNTPLGLLGLQEQRRSELDDPRFYDNPRVAGLKASLDTDIAANPITQQRPEVEAINRANQGALMAGFHGGAGQNPAQEAAEAGRQFETAKMRVPLDVANISGAADVAKQQEANKGALAVTEAKGAQAQNFLDMLNQARMSGADVKGISMPGGGSVSYQTPAAVPPGLLHDVTLTRAALEKAKGAINLFGTNNANIAAMEAANKQAIASALSRHPAAPHIKQFVQGVLNDPVAAKLSLDDILQQQGETDITPEDKQMAQELLNAFRGF